MAAESINRKLTAILSADAKGYSRLMGEDEVGTVQRLKEYREIMARLINQHRGRVVDSPGDNLLAEFGSVVDATKCAVEIQEHLKTKNARLPEEKGLKFRIGINLGDVLEDGDRIYGDGVNITARIESLADAGGICISRTAYDQLKNKLELGYEYLGEHTVKNIAEPVRVYRVLMDPDAAGKVIGEGRFIGGISRKTAMVIIVSLIIVAVGFIGWNVYIQHYEKVDPASLDKMAYPLPEIPSIAVLPFKNLSGSENDGLIARGLTEDIITALSRVQELLVIARASSFTYEGKIVKIRQVSEELGVRYVLDGSVQRSKDRLRFTVQLVDAVAGHQIWADRFDRKSDDIFVLQDDLVRRILVELQVKLTSGEFARIASRKTQNIDAWLLFGQGLHEGFKFTREGMARARELFQAAHEKDRNWARPLVGLSWTYWIEARQGWADDRDEWIRKGLELAEKAVEWAPEEPGGYQMLGMLALSTGDYDRAIAFREKAFKLAPNDFLVNWGLGSVLYKVGEAQRAVGILKRAERQNPSHPVSLLWTISEAHLMAGQYNDAIETSNRAVARNPDVEFPHIILTAAYSAVGSPKKAQTEAAKVLRINPQFTVSAWMKTRLYKDRADTEKISNLLVRAGLPENSP